MKNTTNTPKTVSKTITKKIDAINKLTEKSKKETLTTYELKRLVNAKMFIENKSISKIYKELQKPSDEIKVLITQMLGKNKFPNFKEFAEKSKGTYFSTWKGLSILCEFNLNAKRKTKVNTQNKNIAKK
tara:strand:- start:1759 stop:2145 length:387 start_codon:yes stop_codon:yes gene_type:complete